MSAATVRKLPNLKEALDAFIDAQDRVHELEKQRDILSRQIRAASDRMYELQKDAARALRRQEGAVLHRGRVWEVDQKNDFIKGVVVQLNLDEAAHAANREPTDLTLTPTPSERAA